MNCRFREEQFMGIKPGILCLLGKHSTIGPHPQLQFLDGNISSLGPVKSCQCESTEICIINLPSQGRS